jgi:hypothetical protein
MLDANRKKMDEVLMILHERTMDANADAHELLMARARKAVTPGILEFIAGESQQGYGEPDVREIITALLIFFGEFSAKLISSHSAIPAEEACAIVQLAIGRSFMSIYDQCVNGIQSGETDHPAPSATRHDHD